MLKETFLLGNCDREPNHRIESAIGMDSLQWPTRKRLILPNADHFIPTNHHNTLNRIADEFLDSL